MIDPKAFKTIGAGIIRPEGVVVQRDGTVLTADVRGRIAKISADGKTSFYGDVGGTPNGICLDGEGNCIIANIGNGRCQSLGRDGTHTVLMTEATGKRIPTPNFPFVDSKHRLWVSNSTYRKDMEDAIRNPAPDGCMVLMENGQARIVAEGIYFANGVALNSDESNLYVAATMQRVILQYKIETDGNLTSPEIYGPSPLAEHGYPDGIAFDEAGNLWVTFPFWNAIFYNSGRGVGDGSGRPARHDSQKAHQHLLWLEKPGNRLYRQPGRDEHSPFPSPISRDEIGSSIVRTSA